MPVNTNTAPSTRPLTPNEAAEFLGLDVKTITRWARQSYLPGHPLGQGKRKFWRFYEHELTAWLDTHTNGQRAA
jgi:excisionase family DNA binding protein